MSRNKEKPDYLSIAAMCAGMIALVVALLYMGYVVDVFISLMDIV